MTEEEKFIQEKCDSCLNDTICTERGRVTKCHGYKRDDCNVQGKISAIYDAMKDLQIDKNKKYGNSALSPLHIFYKGDSQNSILIRLDDKLNRIKNNSGADVAGLIETAQNERRKFEKRLGIYLKRYGLSKLNVWTYYRD